MTVTCKLRHATGEHGIVHQTPCGDHANGWNASRSVRGRAQASANQNHFAATSNESLLPTRAEETLACARVASACRNVYYVVVSYSYPPL